MQNADSDLHFQFQPLANMYNIVMNLRIFNWSNNYYSTDDFDETGLAKNKIENREIETIGESVETRDT